MVRLNGMGWMRLLLSFFIFWSGASFGWAQTEIPKSTIAEKASSEQTGTCGNGKIDGDWHSSGKCPPCRAPGPCECAKVFHPKERCDGKDLGERNCDTEGFVGGILQCNANCELDISKCERPANVSLPTRHVGKSPSEKYGPAQLFAENAIKGKRSVVILSEDSGDHSKVTEYDRDLTGASFNYRLPSRRNDSIRFNRFKVGNFDKKGNSFFYDGYPYGNAFFVGHAGWKFTFRSQYRFSKKPEPHTGRFIAYIIKGSSYLMVVNDEGFPHYDFKPIRIPGQVIALKQYSGPKGDGVVVVSKNNLGRLNVQLMLFYEGYNEKRRSDELKLKDIGAATLPVQGQTFAFEIRDSNELIIAHSDNKGAGVSFVELGVPPKISAELSISSGTSRILGIGNAKNNGHPDPTQIKQGVSGVVELGNGNFLGFYIEKTTDGPHANRLRTKKIFQKTVDDVLVQDEHIFIAWRAAGELYLTSAKSDLK
jgi:hypothetical protein